MAMSSLRMACYTLHSSLIHTDCQTQDSRYEYLGFNFNDLGGAATARRVYWLVNFAQVVRNAHHASDGRAWWLLLVMFSQISQELLSSVCDVDHIVAPV